MSKEELSNPNFEQIDITEKINPEKLKDDYNKFLVTETGNVIKGFSFEEKGRAYIIPEPDPVKVLFDAAYLNYLQIIKARSKLLNLFIGPQDENYRIALYDYYSYVNSFAVMLFTSIEAFLNYNIPDDYTFEYIAKGKTEIYDKIKIMDLNFARKMKEVFNVLFQKNFEKRFKKKYQHIINLREFRNSLIHLKPNTDDSTIYSKIYIQGLQFKFEETLDAVMDFINFYIPGTLDYCPCENNY
jgi:hypothetical protein